jgi:hypothetical protein
MLDLAQESSIRTEAGGDIVGGTPEGWLAIGWFTPDYRPLAEKFAANLVEHGAPFHLFARPKLTEGWNTLQKPSVVLAAMDAYPAQSLVLMDVDCIIRGDISPVKNIAADVGITIKARQVRGRDRMSQKRVIVTASSRVVVFRPSEGARAFASEWQRLCGRATTGGDEAHMIWAYLLRPEISYAQVREGYAGREISRDTGSAVIAHDSVHDKAHTWSIKPALKAFERRFLRTGRTKAEMRLRLG